MIHLKKIHFYANQQIEFPYSLPFFGKEIDIRSDVVCLVGENGSGKSTFLECLNVVLGLYTIRQRTTLPVELTKSIVKASKQIKCEYRLSKPKGFFFSAEDFTSYIHGLVLDKMEAKAQLDRVTVEYAKKSVLSQSLARMPHARTLAEIDQLYERDLLTSSHGEAYLDFFKSRIRQNEIYLLDEPETPLSIQNQLALLAIIDRGIKQKNQFIIATHSPILMAIPNAQIIQIRNDEIKEVSYDQIDSVILLKQFMNHPESFFRYLYQED